jgi:hypothetical protein
MPTLGVLNFCKSYFYYFAKNLKDKTTVLPLNFVFKQDANFFDISMGGVGAYFKNQICGFQKALGKIGLFKRHYHHLKLPLPVLIKI